MAYELALARVPQHRARLERLVRAHTGLDVRFNELNLRWGWYGPEAVFHRVELGEPGRSDVLVRAPQLIVGFDAWRSMQSGQLQAGRITFVAPDINLERRKESAPDPGKASAATADSENRTRLLQRWRGGRIEIEGGTLRLPDPAGSSDALALQMRRASLRRAEDDWSASALVFLPERLGHTARVAAQMRGRPVATQDLQGSLRFDGLRLEFAGWRQVFGAQSAITRKLPRFGNGDVSFRVAFDHGRLEKADGHVRAQDVSFWGTPWFLAASAQVPSAGIDSAARCAATGASHIAIRGWQLRVEELDLGAGGCWTIPGQTVSLDVSTGARSVRGTVGDTPLESLAGRRELAGSADRPVRHGASEAQSAISDSTGALPAPRARGCVLRQRRKTCLSPRRRAISFWMASTSACPPTSRISTLWSTPRRASCPCSTRRSSRSRSCGSPRNCA